MPDRIGINPEIMPGKSVIRATRISVELLLRKLAAGATTEDLLDAYPRLVADDIKPLANTLPKRSPTKKSCCRRANSPMDHRVLRFFFAGAVALTLTVTACAQSTSSGWVAGLLPASARIIESASINSESRAYRGLVLWMINPKRVVRAESGGLGCEDWVYGDHWYGPVRLSLLDLPHKKLINTVEIHGMYEKGDFPIPFRVSNGVYNVPHVNGNTEGTPRILNLRDLTGEGVAGQFVLFEYEACAISLTSVAGYSPVSDSAVQYEVETLTDSGKPLLVDWIEQVFGREPIRPGHWDFRWEPGHGFDGFVHERVSFDPAKQVFVKK